MKLTTHAVTAILTTTIALSSAMADEATDILQLAGIRGGLVVHINCGDGRLTAALRTNDRYLVHGLDTNTDRVTVTRRSLQAAHKYGPVTIGAFDGKHLPYVDNLVNLIVVDGPRVLFGAADGWVYCLQTSNGQLAWRFRAAPVDRRIVASNRLESLWRVHGSLLLHDGLVYCTAGRSSFLDGGIWIYALEPKTGAVVYHNRIDTWSRTRRDSSNKPFVPGYHIEGTQSDVLVSQADAIYLGQLKFDRTLTQQSTPYILPDKAHPTKAMDLVGKPFCEPDLDKNGKYEERQRAWIERTQKQLVTTLRQKFGGFSLGDREMGLHVFSPAGFLDDSWFNRTYWMYSATWPGYYLAHRAAKTGQLLVTGPQRTYAVQAFPTRNSQSPLFTPGKKGYLLFADQNGNEPVLDDVTRGTTKGWGFTRTAPPAWFHWVPIRIRAMVLASDRLVVIGPPDTLDPNDPMASFEGRDGSVLHVYSAADGKLLTERRLRFTPVFDGLIATSERLLLCTTDGQVLSLGALNN